MIAKIIISQDLEKRVSEINSLLKEVGLNPSHPDVLYIQKGEKLGIEAARKTKDHFSYKATQAKGKAVVLEDAENITVEAQNAMLKTLEELPEQGLFLIGVSSTNNLLPTVLSRCQIVILNDSKQSLRPDGLEGSPTNVGSNKLRDSSPVATRPREAGQNDIELLLKADIKHRFAYIEKLKDKDEFLVALLHYFRKQILDGKTSKGAIEFTNQLLEAEKWANQNVNIRGILEYLMLNMPLHKG